MKKITKQKSLVKVAIASLCTLSLSGCCKSGPQLSTVEKVALYYIKDVTEPNKEDSIEAYFDFSDGMNWAYQDDTTKAILKDIVNKVINVKEARIYSMADDQITLLPEKTTTLFNTIMSPASYTKKFAPIEKTLARIVKSDKNALLVTDFEEYTTDGRIQTAAFASKYFEEWLNRGYDIKFYITNYVEKSQPKHLYYILFNTNSHVLQSKVEDAIKSQPKNYREFTLSTNPWELSTNYIGAAYGGCYHDASHQDIVSGTDESGTTESYCNFNLEGNVATILQNSLFFKSTGRLNAEYYPMGASWPDIVKNAQSASQLTGNQRFTDLLRGLFIDLTSQDSYIVSRLDIIATDVQQDMDKYVSSLMPQIVGSPEMVDDGEGGLVASPTKEQAPYYDERGNVLPKYIYAAQTPVQIMGAFELNQTLFENTMRSNPSKVEIGIDLMPGFSGNIGGYTQGDMIRIDVIIAECEPNISQLPTLFSWNGNSNLADAIKNTLQNMKPVNRVIYSYFIKTI
jgi:hypothetical protein